MHKHSKHHKHMKGTPASMHKMHEHKHMVGHKTVSTGMAASGHAHMAAPMAAMPKNHSGK